VKPGAVIAFLLLVASAVVTFFSFAQATAKHVTIAQARSMPGVTVQVPGTIDRSTVAFRIRGTRPELRFDITDMQGGSERMTVLYTRPKPENFANATSVEAVGTYSNGEFRAHSLLVKCPSKYQAKNGP